jgi:hypothetical protein
MKPHTFILLRAGCVKYVISQAQTLDLGLCILRHNIEKPDSQVQDVYYASVGRSACITANPETILPVLCCYPSRPNSLISPVLQASTCATSLTIEPPYTGDGMLGALSQHKMAGFPISLDWVLLCKSSSVQAQGYSTTNADGALENWAAW